MRAIERVSATGVLISSKRDVTNQRLFSQSDSEANTGLMIIAQISDTHLLDPATSGPKAQRRLADLRATVAHLKALDPQPDIVVHTGDVSQNATHAEYILAREALDALDVPVLPIVGNRDRRRPFLDVFGEWIGLTPDSDFVQYAFCGGPVRLVAADTLLIENRVGDFCDRRLKMLEDLLDADASQPTVVILHHPPTDVPALRNPLQFISPDAARLLRDVIERNRQILRIFGGHTHRADTVAVGDTLLSTSPSIATELREDTYPRPRETQPVYQIHRILADGSVTSRSEFVANSQ